MKIKFRKENLLFALPVGFVIMFVFPFVITFLSPSVAESVMPELGECDITYKGKFYPCMTWAEALTLNIKFSIIMGLIIMMVLCFIDGEEERINGRV